MNRLRKLLFVVGFVFSLSVVISLIVPLLNAKTISRVSAQATGFNAGHIIDNNIFTNSAALSAAQIQQFLQDMESPCYAPGSKSTSPGNGACLYQYVENTSTLQNNFSNPGATIPGGISAAQIIYDAAQQYDINPEVILTTIEKEQGLTTDDWPYYSEYQYAMGYNCPSTCNSDADFYEQVDGAAWQFRYYLDNPGAFNYWIGTNNINYAPGCAGSSVDIQNAATAALYIYTPYQPDSNVLANTNSIGSPNGPGPTISDGCGSYGNRNFWWYFNTWFGPSVDTNISLGEESGSSTFYLLYDGQKQGIPSLDVLDAWGLNGLPVTTLDAAVFNAIPTASTVLSRYVVNTQTGAHFFADNNGSEYYVSANDALIWGNFPGQTLSSVSSTLTNFADYQAEIKRFVTVGDNPTYYIVDNGSLHPVSSGAVYNLWAGQDNPPMQLSSAYFGTMGQGSGLNNPEFTYNNTDYILSDGEQFSLSSAVADLLPSSWTIASIGQGLFNSFWVGGALHYMLQANNQPTAYLLNSGVLMGIPDLQTAEALQSDSSGDTSIVSSDLINFIPAGSTVGSNIVTISGQSYVVNQALQPIPSSITSAYSPSTNAIDFSSAYLSIFPTGSNATVIVRSPTSSTIYFLDAGNKLPFSNFATYSMVTGSTSGTNLTNGALQSFPNGPVMQNYLTNNSNNYLLDQGNMYTVPSSSVAQAWGLNNPVSVSSSAISNFPNIGTLSQNIQIPNNQFCLVDGTGFCAYQNALIGMWGLNVNTIKPSWGLLSYEGIGNVPIGAFATADPGQQSAGTIYTAANGRLFGITTINNALNLGLANGSIVQLDQNTINNLSASKAWQGYLATDDSGNLWVLDGGIKHAVPASLITAWTGSQTPTILGSNYLSLLPTGSTISNSIKSVNNPTVYGIKNGQEYSMPSQSAYNSSGLSPYTMVYNSLLNAIPYGGTWSN